MSLRKLKGNILSLPTLALCGILLIAFFLRFTALGENPAGLFRDEASTGYDAYSIMLTGRDQYGTLLPLFSRSFGDYNESFYRFLAIPSIYFFGLTEFAVRFPAAVIGLLTIVVFYFLGKVLFNERIALVQALILAISPWHIQFSRVAFRAILFPFFFCLGLLLFFKGLEKKKFLILSAVAFSLSIYTYSSARIFIPLFLAVLSVIFFKDLVKNRIYSLKALMIFLTVFAVLGMYWISPEGMARANATVGSNAVQWVKNYLSYFSPDFLFFNGDPNLRHSIRGFGQLYVFEIFSIAAGLMVLLFMTLKRKRGDLRFRQTMILLFAGIALYPIPAALTEPNHALRAVIGSVLFPLISGYGIYWAAAFFRKKSIKMFAVLGILLILFAGSFNYVKHYFLEYPYYSWYHWDYGWKQAVAFSKQKNYRDIFVSNHFFLPHCFILFYAKYPPEKYQKAPVSHLTQKNLKIYKFSMPPYHILPLEDIDPSRYPGSLIITFPKQAKYLREQRSLEEVGVVKTPGGKVLINLLEKKAGNNVECREVKNRLFFLPFHKEP